jgi:hypothetical protein
LPVVLYGYETWFLVLKEENRMRIFANRVLRKIFGTKKDEVAGDWRRLRNEELHDVYSSPNIFRMSKSIGMGWVRPVGRVEERRGVHRYSMWKPERKRRFGRPRRRRKNNIEMSLQAIGWRCGLD